MTDQKPESLSDTPKPATPAPAEGGEFHKVDTEVQKEAAEVREESGGYD